MEDELGELYVILVAHCSADPICRLMLLFSLQLAKQEPDERRRRIDTGRMGLLLLFLLSSVK